MGRGHHDRGTNGRRCTTRLAGNLGAATRLPPPQALIRPRQSAPGVHRRTRLSRPLHRSPGTPAAVHILTLSSYNTYAITQYY